MIETGSLPQYGNSVHRINVNIDSPISGFELHLMETGVEQGFLKQLIWLPFLVKRVTCLTKVAIFLEAIEAGLLLN